MSTPTQHAKTPNQHADTSYDVVILGGGPAGLSVGSELAKDFKVLLLDNRSPAAPGHPPIANFHALLNPTDTTKFWFVPHDCLADHPELADCRLTHGVMRFLAKTYTGQTRHDPDAFDLAWHSQLFGDQGLQAGYGAQELRDRYPYIDETKILKRWRTLFEERAQRTHSKIRPGCYYRDHQAGVDQVKVRYYMDPEQDHPPVARKTVTVTAKLLLDATGHDSDVRKHYEIEDKNLYWWSVFGCIFKHPPGQIGDQKRLQCGDYMLWQTFKSSSIRDDTTVRAGRPIFEYEVLDETTSFALILYLRPEKMSTERMQSEFLDIITNEPSVAEFRKGVPQEFKFGWYPSGGLTHSDAQDRVDFIGDSGLWTTPCGWGMGYILKNFKPYARTLTPLLKADRLRQRDLQRLLRWRHAKRGEILLNTFATHFLANGTTDQLDRFISLFRPDPILCEKVFTLRVEASDLFQAGRAALKTFQLHELLQVIPPEERWSAAGQLLGVGAQFVREKVAALCGRKPPERGFRVY